MAQEGFLQLGEHAIRRQPFDGDDIAALDLAQRHQAGADLLAIQQHRAGAAIAGIAADLGAGQAEILAQHIGQAPDRRRIDGDAVLPLTGEARSCRRTQLVSSDRRSSTSAASRR